jgi:hypothetical protein
MTHLLLAVLLAVQFSAPGQTGTIQGRVLSADGTPASRQVLWISPLTTLALLAPHDFAGRKLEAGQNEVVEPIEVAIDEHHTAVMISHVVRVVHLAGDDFSVFRSQVDRP